MIGLLLGENLAFPSAPLAFSACSQSLSSFSPTTMPASFSLPKRALDEIVHSELGRQGMPRGAIDEVCPASCGKGGFQFPSEAAVVSFNVVAEALHSEPFEPELLQEALSSLPRSLSKGSQARLWQLGLVKTVLREPSSGSAGSAGSADSVKSARQVLYGRIFPLLDNPSQRGPQNEERGEDESKDGEDGEDLLAVFEQCSTLLLLLEAGATASLLPLELSHLFARSHFADVLEQAKRDIFRRCSNPSPPSPSPASVAMMTGHSHQSRRKASKSSAGGRMMLDGDGDDDDGGQRKVEEVDDDSSRREIGREAGKEEEEEGAKQSRSSSAGTAPSLLATLVLLKREADETARR